MSIMCVSLYVGQFFMEVKNNTENIQTCDNADKKIEKQHFCYILNNAVNDRWTYNGYTNAINKRLRQHNGEIKGGAKYTSKFGKGHWSYLAIVTTPDFTHVGALSFEWSIKYPNNRRPRPSMYQGSIGRVNGLANVFLNPKFMHLGNFTVFVHDTMLDAVIHAFKDDGRGRVTILPMSSFVF